MDPDTKVVLFVREGTYADREPFFDQVQRLHSEDPAVHVEIIETVGDLKERLDRDVNSQVSAVVFFSGSMIATATKFKMAYTLPNVIVLTGHVPADKVTIVDMALLDQHALRRLTVGR